MGRFTGTPPRPYPDCSRNFYRTVAALAALPPGRAVVMLSGARPVLVAAQSAHEVPHAAAFRDSIARYGTPV